MKSLKISHRLLWPYMFVWLLFAVLFLVSLISFTNMGKQAKALYNKPYVLKSAASTVNKSIEATQKSLFRAVLNDSQDITNEAIKDAANSAAMIQEQAALLKQNTFKDMESFSKLEYNLSQFEQMQEHVVTLVTQNKNAEASLYMENSMIPAIKETQNELEHFTIIEEKRAQELLASSQQSQKQAIILLISLGIYSIIVSVGGCIFIWRYQKKEKHNRKTRYK